MMYGECILVLQKNALRMNADPGFPPGTCFGNKGCAISKNMYLIGNNYTFIFTDVIDDV